MQQHCCLTGALYEVLPLRHHVMFVREQDDLHRHTSYIATRRMDLSAQTHSTDPRTQHQSTHLHKVGDVRPFIAQVYIFLGNKEVIACRHLRMCRQQ